MNRLVNFKAGISNILTSEFSYGVLSRFLLIHRITSRISKIDNSNRKFRAEILFIGGRGNHTQIWFNIFPDWLGQYYATYLHYFWLHKLSPEPSRPQDCCRGLNMKMTTSWRSN